MLFYSTNKRAKEFSFKEVLLLGIAPDGGLFMPQDFPKLPKKFFIDLPKSSFHEIAKGVAKRFITEISRGDLEKIIREAFNFSVPLKRLDKNLYVLELFHGPTMAFKDFGARFLARIMGYFARGLNSRLNIIVATSGDTGSAVASGFFKVPNIHVYILYPSKKVSPFQEKQLTTYGYNITAFEVRGTFDDCQNLAKKVLGDADLNSRMKFSSANSINFGRLLPQSFYYFYAAGQLKNQGIKSTPVFVVPSGNFGHLTSGLIAGQMGLAVHKFIAATNANDVFPKYLKTGKFKPQKSKHTISNAMDVGNPSNFIRIQKIYQNSLRAMNRDILGFSVSDKQTLRTIDKIYSKYKYILDPHTAVGITAALKSNFIKSRPVIVLATAHPAKFKEVVDSVIEKKITYPPQLRAAAGKKKKSILVSKNYKSLKKILLKCNEK